MLQTSPTHARGLAARYHRLSAGTRLLIWLGLGIVLLFIVWHFVSVFLASRAHKPPPAVPVKTAVARRADVAVVERTIATVVATATVQVTAQVDGKLLSAGFVEGQIVHRGDLLFQIDPRPFRSALLQANAQLAKDQAQLVSLDNDKTRQISLLALNATSAQLRDQAVAAAAGGAASVQSDKAAVAIAEQNLGYTQIRSPVDGKTGPILIQPGNLVAANGNPLVTITQVQPIKVSFFMPQDQLQQIQNQLSAGALEIDIPIDGAAPERAKVDFVSNIVNAATGTIELRATFPNTDLRLVPGQSVHVGVTLGNLKGVTVVPRDAVNLGPDSSYVYVVGPKSAVASKTVTVLNDDGVTDAIKGDIKPGDTVVTEGQIRLVDGTVVKVSQAAGAQKAVGTKKAAQ